jgi:hypothetical protein
MTRAQTSLKVPALPDKILRQLAEIGRVPSEQHDFFFETVRRDVETACQLDGLVGGLSTKKGKTLANASMTLYDALGNLAKTERHFLKATLSERELTFHRISSKGAIEEIIYQLALLFCLLNGKAPPRPPWLSPESPSRGRRSGSVKNWIGQNFVWDLLIATTTADGGLTLEKNIRGGSLIEAVDLLAPYLPDRLALSRLSTSTLQRIKDAHGEVQRTADKLDRD